MSKEHYERTLRNLELEAFSSILSVFRAQGDLSSKKLKIVKHLSAALNIPPDRYKAEIRKAVNDPVLTAISSSIHNGNDCRNEWLKEGRRLIDLLPRVTPQNAYTIIANQIPNENNCTNAKYPNLNFVVSTKFPTKEQTIKNRSTQQMALLKSKGRRRKKLFTRRNCVTSTVTATTTTATITVPPTATLTTTSAITKKPVIETGSLNMVTDNTVVNNIHSQVNITCTSAGVSNSGKYNEDIGEEEFPLDRKPLPTMCPNNNNNNNSKTNNNIVICKKVPSVNHSCAAEEVVTEPEMTIKSNLHSATVNGNLTETKLAPNPVDVMDD